MVSAGNVSVKESKPRKANAIMKNPTEPNGVPAPNDLIPLSLSVEGGLAILAILGGWLFQIDVVSQLDLSQSASDLTIFKVIFYGVLGIIPMIILLLLIENLPFGPFKNMKRFSRDNLAPMFKGMPVIGLVVISFAAGFGEELLFRGLVQSAASQWMPIYFAVLVAGITFGLMHYMTVTYAVLATLMGCYLGWLFAASGQIWVPIISHAAYDFIALLYLSRIEGETPEGSQQPKE